MSEVKLGKCTKNLQATAWAQKCYQYFLAVNLCVY